MTAHSILITDRFALDSLALLQSRPELSARLSDHFIPTADELRGVEGLIIRSRTKITAAFLLTAPDLKVIITATSGFDHIDLDATRASGIVVMFTPNANAQSAAELTLGLVLACARHVPQAHRAIKAGDWNRDALMGSELSGRTYGIVGLGRIGSKVARMAHAFGMNVVAFDPYKDEEFFTAAGAQRLSFEEVLKVSDVISIHVPKTPETFHMFKRNCLEFMARGIILVNTSRGNVICEADLVEALENKWLSAVGLDVFEKEPLARNSGLLQFANVVLTPHLGATTTEAFAKASDEAAHKIIEFFAQPSAPSSLSDTLPPAEPWYNAPSWAGSKTDSSL
jgi:D-3-phosphoglycerate dehydrogenase